MADKNADQIKAYYTELSKLAPSQDWERILKTAKKILGISLTEKKAFQTKVICLINLDKFDEALGSIERFNFSDNDDLYFERAYCQYRLNQVEEAYKTLSKCENPGLKEKELMAQISYRLERYQEAYDTYRDIIKNADVDDDYETERTTNLSAVCANLPGTNFDMSENEDKTFELCYNSACMSISKGNFAEAQAKLEKAEIMCQEMFKEEDPDDVDGLEREVVVIRAQLAYCLQKLGKSEEALKVYNNVLKTRKADAAVNACIANNLVCINKDQNVFDSKKRIKTAKAQELRHKLTLKQQGLIAYNEILFCIITSQNKVAQQLLEKYAQTFNDKERYSLLKMAQLCKEKKYQEAEMLLFELQKGSCSPTVLFYLLQIYLTQGKVDQAIDLIPTLEDFKNFKLGIVSAMVTLMASKKRTGDATKLLESAINYHSGQNASGSELKRLIKENANYQLMCGNYPGACEMLEKLRAMDPSDFRILSKLINIYSKFDSETAKRLSTELPSLEDIIANSTIDLDTLENQFSLLSSKTAKLLKSGTAQVNSPEKVKSPDSEKLKTIKKKKKRKILLPKKMDPKVPIDPERWIPLKERSYYRGRKNKKKGIVFKGAQGAVGKETGSGVTPTSPRAKADSPAVEAKPAAESKPKPSANKSKPKKKKGKGGW